MYDNINGLTTRDGVRSLRAMVAQLNLAASNLLESATTVKTIFDLEKDKLGPFQQRYEEILAFANVAINDASGDIDTLKKKLSATADSIENWLNSQSSTGTGSTSTSTSDAWPNPPVKVKKKVR